MDPFLRLSMVSGAELVAQLTPMKRILCLCPVARPESVAKRKKRSKNFHEYSVGMALSDPYLAQALPLNRSGAWKDVWRRCDDSTYQYVSDTRKKVPIKDWLDRCLEEEYSDIGALALAFPMKEEANPEKEDELLGLTDEERMGPTDEERVAWKALTDEEMITLKDVREEIFKELLEHLYFGGYLSPTKKSGLLVCDIDQRFSWKEVQQMARENPGMWEEILEEEDHHSNSSAMAKTKAGPSRHAFVALNHFLWKHSGGWQNTFG